MKLLIVSQYYDPEQFQINDIAPELVRRGHEVTVLTGLPNYPAGVVPAQYRHGQRREETVNGVRILRTYERGRGKGAVNLLMNYVSFALSASRKARKLPRFDAVLCYQLSPVSIAAPAIAYKKKNHVPVLLYCLDIWPESAKAHLPGGFLFGLIGKYSKKLYSQCDRIAVTSRPFLDYLTEVNGIPAERMCYIPQHADGAMLNTDLTAPDNGIVDFMYAGNLGQGQTLDVIVRAAAELKDREGFLVHMVGDGSARESLQALANELGVGEKIRFHGNQKRGDMPAFYKMADALLITLRGNNAVGNTMPGKLQMYMTAGKPVLGAINGAANEVIRESACGNCVGAGDYKGLASLMADLMDHPEKYAGCGEKAKAYFEENFTLEKFSDALEAELANLTAERTQL